jgi:peroxiredoxin
LNNRMSGILFLAGILALTAAVFLPVSSYHPVTLAMLTSANAKSGSRVPATVLEGSDDRVRSIAEIAADRLTILIFIKDGCPCSELAEPYFRRLHAIYGAGAVFLGVIDGEATVAHGWSGRHHSPFPVLADPDLRVIRACGAERSAYVALVAPGGSIDRLRPGYSAGMLAELGTQLAARTTLPESPIEIKDAPKVLSSGCAF